MSSLGEEVVRTGHPAALPGGARKGRFGRVGRVPGRTPTRSGLRIDIGEGSAPPIVTSRDTSLRRLLVVSDLVAVSLAVVLAVAVFGNDALQPATLLLLPLVVVSSRLLGLYDRDEIVLAKTTMNEGPALFHLATLCTLILYVGEHEMVGGHLGLGQGVTLWLGVLLASGACRSLSRHVAVRQSSPERVVVIGDEDRVARICDKLQQGWALNVEVARCIALHELPDTSESRARLIDLVREADAHRVVVATGDGDSEHLLAIIRETKALGVKVSIQPRLLDVVGSAVEFESVHGDVFLGVRHFGLKTTELRMKRVMDIVGAVLLLPIVGPVLALAAIAIKLDSRGPVFFRQERIGRDGRPFRIWKLRTMVVDAEQRKPGLMSLNEAGGGLFKMARDPRITRVGQILRRTAIDEVPQVFNVLMGQMSLVGPRPLVPTEDQRIAGWHRRRLHLVPGMTGVWQVLGSARIPLQDMVALDYLYIVNWSVWNDIQILFRTVSFVLRGRGL